MRIFFVSLLAALLLAATASVALAQDSGIHETDPGVERDQESPSGGSNTDWIRTVGILGIAGVWGMRGINNVRRNRLEREAWAAESAAETVDDTTAPAPETVEGAR